MPKQLSLPITAYKECSDVFVSRALESGDFNLTTYPLAGEPLAHDKQYAVLRILMSQEQITRQVYADKLAALLRIIQASPQKNPPANLLAEKLRSKIIFQLALCHDNPAEIIAALKKIPQDDRKYAKAQKIITALKSQHHWGTILPALYQNFSLDAAAQKILDPSWKKISEWFYAGYGLGGAAGAIAGFFIGIKIMSPSAALIFAPLLVVIPFGYAIMGLLLALAAVAIVKGLIYAGKFLHTRSQLKKSQAQFTQRLGEENSDHRLVHLNLFASPIINPRSIVNKEACAIAQIKDEATAEYKADYNPTASRNNSKL